MLWTTSVAAQETGDDGDDILVEATRPDPRSPTAMTSRFDTDELVLRGGDLAEGFRAIPGALVRRRGFFGAPAQLTLRGAAPNQVVLLFDGIPVDPVAGGGGDLTLLPASLAESVDVYRGASAVRFGSGAIGGAVNVVPKVVTDGFEGRGFLSGGSFATTRAGLAASGGSRTLFGTVAVDALSTDGSFPFEDDQGTQRTRTNSDARRLAALVHTGAYADRDTEVVVTDLVHVFERGAPGPGEFQSRLDEARRSDRRNLASLRLTRYELAELGPAVLDGQARLSWRWQESVYDNPEPLLLSPVATSNATTENETWSTFELGLYAPKLTTFVGANLGTQWLDRTSGSSASVLSRQRDRVSGWITTEFRPADGWSLASGVRSEWFGGVGGVATPTIGAVVPLADDLDLVGNVARAWRAPSFDELYLDNELVQGNEALEPEQAWSADVGLVATPAKWARVELAAFYLDIDQLILFVPISATAFVAQNTGKATSRGTELSGTIQPSRHWRGSLVWTWNRARLDNATQDPLPGRPSHHVFTSSTVFLGPLQWSVSLDWRSALPLDRFGSLYDEPATFVDTSLAWVEDDGFTAAVTARNLLDHRSAVDSLQIPLPGRSLFAQVGWGFVTE